MTILVKNAPRGAIHGSSCRGARVRGSPKSFKPLDRFNNVPRGQTRVGFMLRAGMVSGFFEQTRGVLIYPHALRSSLTNEFGLKLRPDLNRDGH